MAQLINGGLPIPGENFTSDTKNYPWHQPPEYRNIYEALDKMAIKLTEPKTAQGLIAFAEAGFPLIRIAQMVLMEGMAQGKWTLDMALLMAGPITKIIEIMCDLYEVEYNIGIEEKDDQPTGRFFKNMTAMDTEAKNAGIYKVVRSEMEQIKEEAMDQPGAETAETAEQEEPDIQEQGFASMTQAPAVRKVEKT